MKFLLIILLIISIAQAQIPCTGDECDCNKVGEDICGVFILPHRRQMTLTYENSCVGCSHELPFYVPGKCNQYPIRPTFCTPLSRTQCGIDMLSFQHVCGYGPLPNNGEKQFQIETNSCDACFKSEVLYFLEGSCKN